MIIRHCEAKEVFAMRARPWRKYDDALSKNSELYSQIYNSGPIHLDKILRWSKFADWLSGTNLPPPRVCLPEGRIKAGREYLRPTVVLVPFSAVKEKQISPDVFHKIMDHLKHNYDFIVAGAPGDFDINPEYLTLLKTRNTTFDTCTFEDLASKLMRVDLVVSVDTAAMHLSVSLGTPTVCLASAAYVNEIVPYSSEVTPDNVRFVFQAMECQGCLGSCSLPLEDDRFPCVARLKPNHILNAIDELLNK
jgi:ADP-heptose:LPS heptosyltransferase